MGFNENAIETVLLYTWFVQGFGNSVDVQKVPKKRKERKTFVSLGR